MKKVRRKTSSSSSLPLHRRKSCNTIHNFCSIAVKLIILCFLICCLALNLYAQNEISAKFEKEFEELNNMKSQINEIIQNNQVPESVALNNNYMPITNVITALNLLLSVEKDIRFPKTTGQKKIVILGKTFIMRRDFEIWDHTFTNAGFNPIKTNKQELQSNRHSDWVGLKCLDLFDGKSHCIEPAELVKLKKYQKVSRLYGLRKTLWNKDRFCDTLSSALSGFKPAEEVHLKNNTFLEFVFPCWLLPNTYEDLIRKARTVYKGQKFIAKPTDRGEGNGINVLDTIQEISRWKELYPDNDEIVVQTYLPNPLLINQRKWDMSFRVYMYRDGLVRFASSVYEADAAKGGKKTAFLTNTSVNKKTGADVNDLTWPFPKVFKYLQRHGIDAPLLWKRIERAVVQTMLSAEPAFARGFTKLQDDYTCINCYQLLGVDVIVDDTLTPRIIEINGEPSMELSGERGSQYDITKKSMTRDLVNLIYSGDSFSRAVAKDLSRLELNGYSVGYEQLNTCSFAGTKNQKNTFCLRKSDLEYLLEMKKEEQNMGGFRRIYPSNDGEFYSEYIDHLESKMPYGVQSSTGNIHKLATEMQKLSTWKSNNHILDATYFRRVSDFEDDES